MRSSLSWILLVMLGGTALADPPVALYIFPAGGQRGTTVQARVGGCCFNGQANFQITGAGIHGPTSIRQIETTWFEGPLIYQPASQRQEDYPKDHAAEIRIDADAAPGIRPWRVSTSQGATTSLPFVIGDFPEVVEQETEAAPTPVHVKLPVTINGRIFPRENVDIWAFDASAGQAITADVAARRLGSTFDPELEFIDPAGASLSVKPLRVGADPRYHFTAGKTGKYLVRIHDVAYGGLQNYVYRLTLIAGPTVDHVYPLGGHRGEKLKLQLSGHGLTQPTTEVALPASGDSAAVTLTENGNEIGSAKLDLDDLPEVLESETNDKPADVKPIAIPAVFNGRIDHPGDVDYWAIEAKKNEAIDLEVRAARLGSRLDSVLSVEDSTGKQLARNDDSAPGQIDSLLTFKAPADGIYYIRIEDRFASRGGFDFAYRLRATPAKPDFRVTCALDAVTLTRPLLTPLPAGDKRVPTTPPLKFDVQRLGGFDGPITLTFDGLPPGVSVTGNTVLARQLTAQVKFSATPDAKIGAAHIQIHATATIAGELVDRRVALSGSPAGAASDDFLLGVAIPTPFKFIGEYQHPFVPCGSSFHRHYALDRGGFTGPITVTLADRQARHLQGVRATPLIIPPEADSFDYAVFLAPEMELGRTVRAVIALTATLKDSEGSEHVVSYSSAEQADQFVSVATAPLLTLRPDRSTILANAGSQNLAVLVQRADVIGDQPVRVSLHVPEWMHGIKAETVTLNPGQSNAVIQIVIAPDAGPFTAPIIMHASTIGHGDPNVAESKIEFVKRD